MVMYTQKKPIENTHIVRERDRRRFRELLAVLFLGVPIGLFLLLFTWQNLEVIRLGHEATRLQQQLKDTATRNKALQLELDRLTAFDSVQKQAVALGFEATPAASIVMVAPSDGVSRVIADSAGQLGRSARPIAAPIAVPAVSQGAVPQQNAGERGVSRTSLIVPAVAAATPSDGRR